MRSALVAALSAPMHEVRALVGPGGAAADDTAVALAGVRDALGGVSGAAGRSWDATGTRWTGAAADAADAFTRTTVAAIDALSQRADHLGVTVASASDAVARARSRLDAIIDAFEARAAELEAALDSPSAAREIADEARRATEEATAVVDELSTELDSAADAVAAPADPGISPTPSRGMSGWAGLGSGLGSAARWGAGGLAPSATSGLSGSGSGSAAGPGGWGGRTARAVTTPDPGMFGDGVAVHLPGGATAMAPNAVAASAVRHALTQLGVPYDWGGTTPGVGLDCSGLTQWAYREAGLELPRLAQEQDVGSGVDPGSLRPGDLAVWDGHVAMIVGDGLMIEAGDPVQLSPIRTSNAGEGFQGFWRPTA